MIMTKKDMKLFSGFYESKNTEELKNVIKSLYAHKCIMALSSCYGGRRFVAKRINEKIELAKRILAQKLADNAVNCENKK